MANTVYQNFVLENKLNDILATKLAMSQFLTVNTSLEGVDGMIYKVNTYNSTGDVQDVAEGAGNTDAIEMSYTTNQYVVGTTQGRFIYSDEAAMTDSFLVEGGLQHLADKMVNDFNEKAIAEYAKGTNKVFTAEVGFDDFVDAIAKLKKEDSEENGFFALINTDMKAELRKKLADELKYVEDYVRSGYIGSLCGIPIYTSKLVPAGSVYVASKAAITAFMKKTTEIEQDREPNTRTNTVYARNVKVIALTDNNYLCQILVGADGYHMVHEQPADWATDWTDYYEMVNGRMTALATQTAPVFADGKYYAAD